MGGLIKRLAPITSSKSIIEKFDIMERIYKRVNAEGTRLKQCKMKVNIFPQKSVFMIGDPIKFDQIISNLLLNAIDSINERMKQTKKIRVNRIGIKVEKLENELKLAFSDNGTGISAKDRGKIFDPFYTTKPPGKGEGLGLFIIWNLLKMQGGKISLDPKYKHGARFLITIPKVIQDKKEF